MEQEDYERQKEMLEHVDWVIKYFSGISIDEVSHVREHDKEFCCRREKLSGLIGSMVPKEKAAVLESELTQLLKYSQTLGLESGVQIGLFLGREIFPRRMKQIRCRPARKKKQRDYNSEE